MTKIGNNGSGKTDWYGAWGTILRHGFSGEVFTGLNVEAQASPNMTVKVNAGSAILPTGTSPAQNGYLVRLDASSDNVTITTANPTNPRNDLIVAYYDITVIDGTNPNNPNALKFAAVAGTPSATPADPNTAAIQSAIGASNPYAILARVVVAAGATTITNPNIADLRTMASAVLAPQSVQPSQLKSKSSTTAFTRNTSAFSAATAEYLYLEGNILHFSFTNLTPNSDIADTTTTILTIDLAALGIASTKGSYKPIGLADGSNTLLLMTLDTNGALKVDDSRPNNWTSGLGGGVSGCVPVNLVAS